MKVILLENLRKIGSIGDVIDVKRGFARNYLIANKKALHASNENIKEWDSLKHLSLVLAIEEEFNIRFTNDETLQLTSFKNIAEILKNNHKIY